ncbi:MAG: ATP-binding cassette domain-containing protein, partial [Bacteroidia bacterium]|nr:ATP-binding cassette domain-containing protein [Bacteroidia bacterium]
ESLNLNHTIWQEIVEYAPDLSDTYLRTVLGCLLFSGDDIHKKISILSGGEKARVALAKTLLSKANLLLLDEPTNHLDMVSIEVLIQALKEYPGTYVIVSHDRYFLSQTTNKIWYIENKQIKEYPGNYLEYEEWKKNTLNSAPNIQPSFSIPKTSEKKNISTPNTSQEERKRIKQIQNQLKNVEALIMQLESEKSILIEQMNQPENASNFEKLKSLQEKYEAIDKQLTEALEKWEKLETSLITSS